MLSADELEARRALLADSADLTALARRLAERAAPVIGRRPPMPRMKALLSTDGGICPDDGTPLAFDPWSPAEHRCPKCGRGFSGERHDRAWARFQHLWLAEQAATLAALGAVANHRGAAEQAAAILAEYAGAYFQFPNRDNVLGPSRLFFSTYLESIWLNNYLAAATLLREAGLLADSTAEGINAVADEAANLIGEFDEGFSNRQTWNNAALAAIAIWFEDEELATRAVESETGVVAQLMRGFGEDGLWYEGENYHLFALRGQLLGMGWVAAAGGDLLRDPSLARQLASALRAPAVTALPDRTFPARKDSRFGISLAQPMYLELWEVGLARLDEPPADLWGWLAELYASPPPAAATFDSYLYEAGAPAPTAPRSRVDLSWWSLLEMAPAFPVEVAPWSPGPELLESQGLAILRRGDRYASLECGPYGGGHGHPDRLHLTLHANGRHWLADPGTGSYVSRDLFWYRSTLAHNAPMLDGVSQPVADAWCSAFDADGEWAWTRGVFGETRRTLIAGPRYLLDIVELSASVDHRLELPWHPAGAVEVVTAGSWTPDEVAGEFVTGAERLSGRGGGAVLRARDDAVTLALHLLFEGDLLRAAAPGNPGTTGLSTFYIERVTARNATLVAVLEPSDGVASVREVRTEGAAILVETAAGTDRHVATADGWEIAGADGTARLGGARRRRAPPKPLIDMNRAEPERAFALHVADPPPLDGSLEGFEVDEPIALDHEGQYRRSEEAFAGPEEFSATAVLNWDADALYLGLDVVKPDVVFREAGAPPLRLDNEPDDLNSDGVQVYVRLDPEAPAYGFLAVPADDVGNIRVRVTEGNAGSPEMVRGGWQRTDTGYSMSLALTLPGWAVRSGDEIGFDLIVNEMRPERTRRAGQLAWGGGGGWVYLRGDRHAPERMGVVELR